MTVQLPAASYVLSFFSDVKNLTDGLAAFNNCLVLLKSKSFANGKEISFDEALSKGLISQEEHSVLLQTANNIRFFATQAYIKFLGMGEKFPELKAREKELTEKYEPIQTSVCPKYEAVRDYTVLCHVLFNFTSLNDLLLKSQQYYEQMSGLNESVDE